MVTAVMRPRRESNHEPVCQPMPVGRRCPGREVEGVASVMQNEAETAIMPTHGDLMLTS